MSGRIIKETMLHIHQMDKAINMLPDSVDLSTAAEVIEWRPSKKGIIVKLHRMEKPEEYWAITVRGKRFCYRTSAEAKAFLRGRYNAAPYIPATDFDFQLFMEKERTTEPMVRDESYYEHPVVQHLRDEYTPWCVQFRGNGRHFKSFAEMKAYIEGRWHVDIGDCSVYW